MTPATADSRVPRDLRRAREARGFTVAELLSALFVLAVGVLGVVALYVDQSREQERNPRTIATALAQQMGEHIRSLGPAEKAPRMQLAPFCTQPPGTAESLSGGDTLAQDVACWQEKVANALPNGTGLVEKEDSTAGYKVTVSWSEAGVGAASVVLQIER